MITTEEALYLPTECPTCKSKLEFTETKVDLICTNLMCPAKLLSRIEHYCRCMGIEEISIVTLEKLELQSILMLYELTRDYITSFDGFGTRKAEIILEQISKSLDDVLPAKLIEAFGIPGVGEKTAELIYRILKGNTTHNKIEHFLRITKEELYFVDGVGEKTAQNIITMQDEMTFIYKHLKDDIKFKSSNVVSEKLLNKHIAMTGASPDGRTRPVLEGIIKSHGGIPGSVTKSTNILIAEDPNGSSGKLKNARKYGIQIMSYEEFFRDL